MMFETEKRVNFANPMIRNGMETQDEHEVVNYDQGGEALKSVVEERIRQLEAGEVETIPNELVFAEIRERYGF